MKLALPCPYGRIAHLFTPYRVSCVLFVACAFVVAIATLVPSFVTKYLVDAGLMRGDYTAVLVCVGAMLVAAAVSASAVFYQTWLSSYTGEAIVRDLRVALVTHLHRQPVGFFFGTKSGEILNRASNDVDTLEDTLSKTLPGLVSNGLSFACSLAAMAVLDLRLALVALFALPMMISPVAPLARPMRAARRRSREARDVLQAGLSEILSLSGIILIKAFGREPVERALLYRQSDAVMDAEVASAMSGLRLSVFLNVVAMIAPALVWLVGGYLVVRHATSPGTVVAFATMLARIYMPASALAGGQAGVLASLAVFERVFAYLDLPAGDEGEQPGGSAAPRDLSGSIGFDDVSFGYTQGTAVLDGVSFRIAAGETVALVGRSGAGKTTLAYLLLRFFQPWRGTITVDGIPIDRIDRTTLRSCIGVVTQETHLVHDTICNNIRYGRLDADDRAIREAAAAAGLDEFIRTLPDGYDTMVGERGYKLSGGQRQRIAIARAFLRDPAILILDEATSQLDTITEASLQDSIRRLTRTRTSLIITHRLSTIAHADAILVIDGSRLVEMGRHDELLERGGVYAELYNSAHARNLTLGPGAAT